MKKYIKSLAFLFIIILSSANVYCKNGINNKTTIKKGSSATIAIAPPTVTTPVYLCQNSVALPLTATPSVIGATLNWYTVPVAGIASLIAPVPSTTAVGTTTYYVSETVLGIESTRVAIVVNVVADNGATILGLRCDPSQVTTSPVTSVFFDWGNNPLTPSNSYNYSYSIQGGPAVTGNKSPTNLEVFGLLPGQSVTLTITAVVGYPCVPPVSMTCTVPCLTTTTPDFASIPAFCTGTVAPVLSPTSPNGITGTWLPAIINNTTSGSYVFTPDPIAFPCALTQTLATTVLPLATPTFTTIPTTVCQNAVPPVLPLNSSNTTPISGTWIPATVDTSILGTTVYTFTPNPGQCASATFTTASITIAPVIVPDFALIPAFCSGTLAPVLATTSPNGITGTWLPAIISNTISGNYLFTPNANICATTQTLSVTIIPRLVPNFSLIPAFCTGTVAPILANLSPNGITGSWQPVTIDNTASGSYVFTPNPTECATTQTLVVTVNQLINPSFTDIAICFGSTAPNLNTTSPNGITGTWLPTSIDNTTSGTYLFTPDANQCAASKTITVTVNQITLTNVDWTVTNAFTKNQIVTIIATATGDYLYQLDDGPFQLSPIFEHVASGLHSITVKDANGCGTPITITNVLVINYPKYFTPNSDGYNDTWNIFDLKDQQNSRVFIFDRYGKLLKEIRPKGAGWDGTYNGQPMPANDYWFSVEYSEENTPKKFKAHFSLKR